MKQIILYFIILILSSCQYFYKKPLDNSKSNHIIIATYNNGKEITLSQAQKELDKITLENKTLQNTKFEDLNLNQKERIIEKIIVKKAAYQEATKQKLHKDENYKKLIKDFKINLLQQLLILHFQEQATDENLLKSEYKKLSKNLYNRKDYNVSYIITDDYNISKNIYHKLKKDPELFSKKAKEKSIDYQTAKNGGNLGFVLEDVLPVAILNQIKKLQKEEISKPFKFKDKWIIIKFIDQREAQIIKFEDAKESLIKGLTIKNIQNFNTKIIKEANIKIITK